MQNLIYLEDQAEICNICWRPALVYIPRLNATCRSPDRVSSSGGTCPGSERITKYMRSVEQVRINLPLCIASFGTNEYRSPCSRIAAMGSSWRGSERMRSLWRKENRNGIEAVRSHFSQRLEIRETLKRYRRPMSKIDSRHRNRNTSTRCNWAEYQWRRRR